MFSGSYNIEDHRETVLLNSHPGSMVIDIILFKVNLTIIINNNEKLIHIIETLNILEDWLSNPYLKN